MSSEGDLMHDSNKNVIGSNDYVGPHPPPPPLPFQTPRINSPPMQSIRTSIEGQGETDTVVSDPTLDAGLDDSIGTPSPRPSRPKPVVNNSNDSRPQLHHTSSSSTNSYEKKLSDDTNLLTRVRSLSSDENLSSNEGQTGIKVVDDIVAAALAYAEMTHGVAAGSRAGTAVRRGSGTTTLASSQHPIPSTPQSSVQKKKPSKGASKKHKEARSIATSGESSSSVHSYYSKKRGGQHNTTSPGHPCSTPVDELLVKAFSQAHHGHGHVGEQHQQQYRQKQQWSSRGSAAQSMKSGISVESVYSQEETEFSTRADYDC